MLNVMENATSKVRGCSLRLPLDVLVMASASEDYTTNGRIITRSGPVRRRITHYPLELDDEVAVIEREADLTRPSPC